MEINIPVYLLHSCINYSKETEESLFSNINNKEEEEIKDIFRQVEWNAQTVASFQKSVQSSTIRTICSVSMYYILYLPNTSILHMEYLCNCCIIYLMYSI